MLDTGLKRTLYQFEQKYAHLDNLTIEQLIHSRSLEKEDIYREYTYYNILMIKYDGKNLISQLRKLRFEKFIEAHMELFYSGEKAKRHIKEQIKWFNSKLLLG